MNVTDRRNSLCWLFNDIICYVRCLRSVTKLRLLESYCLVASMGEKLGICITKPLMIFFIRWHRGPNKCGGYRDSSQALYYRHYVLPLQLYMSYAGEVVILLITVFLVIV